MFGVWKYGAGTREKNTGKSGRGLIKGCGAVFEGSGVAIGAGNSGGVEWLFGEFDLGKRRKKGEMGEGRDGRKAGMSGE
jgi:hypothetical protein